MKTIKNKFFPHHALSVFVLLLSGCQQVTLSPSTENAHEITKNQSSQPNILWIITDDHRPDSISAYNKAIYGTDESPLGYVESQHADKLAEEGILFTQAFTNSPVCAPSRAAMHSGKYPFRSGRYAFELSHDNPDIYTPLIADYMREEGYGTATFGKEDHYFFDWLGRQSFSKIPNLFDTNVHFKHDIQRYGLGDIFVKADYGDVPGNSIPVGLTEHVQYPNGTERKYFVRRNGEPLREQDLAEIQKTDKEFEILRVYTRASNKTIIGGENPNPKDDTIDAKIVKEFRAFLNSSNNQYKTLAGKPRAGVNPNKPLFTHLGFHLPHTPVLPPKSIRERFKTKQYNIPKFDESEVDKLPPQLQQVYRALKMYGMTEAEMQQAIQDYYAFSAHGDELIGEAVSAFKAYSEKHNQEWVVVYTIGDHGWHLGENGVAGKAGPWQQSVANAAIITASDKSIIPKGLVNHDLVEFVDFAPTILSLAGADISQAKYAHLDGQNLIDVAKGNVAPVEYVLGELNVISGHRAYLHSKRFRFSMRTRPFKGAVPGDRIGEDIRWALTASAKEVEMALYDLEYDPLEQNNLAYTPEYEALAAWFRDKLGNIVLGDGRVEVDWSKPNHYIVSNFADGADDKKLIIPPHLLPDNAIK